MQAVAVRTLPRVDVLVRSLDRSALAALAFALSLSWDVRAVHVDTRGETTRRVRERWRRDGDGIRLDVVSDDDALVRSIGDGALVVVPTIATRMRLLYPLVNWSTLRMARRLGRRSRALITLAYPV